ncbi:MAG TPA: acyl-CoA dehydrogenase family protein [Ramlibacter sp.]|nr:acyl-CoA dehydrogenase family protein [Ramlibacter sp.]
MILDLTPEQELFRATARRFLEHESGSASLRTLNAADSAFDRSWWRRTAELGWSTLLLPEALGGGSISDSPLTDLSIFAEEIGAFAAPGPLAITSVVMLALREQHSKPIVASALADISSGAAIPAWAVYEPGKGWQPTACSTSAVAQDDGFRISGVKDRVEAGDMSDLFLVTATLDGQVAQFLVPARAPGVKVARMWSLDFTRHFAQVTFDNVELSADALVSCGEESIERQSQLLYALQCAETAGATQRVFDMTLDWAFDRIAFGRSLASYQAVKHRFADMKSWLEAMHATTSDAVAAVQHASPQACVLTRVANLFVSTRALAIMQECVQLHGGIGVTWEHDLHIYLRRATVNSVMYGTPIEHRASLRTAVGQQGRLQ